MKTVLISSKQYKKQLLLSNQKAVVFFDFLLDTIKNEVMIINTNLGINVYYRSSINHKKLIIKTFLLVSSEKEKNESDYIIISIDNFERFKTYTYSFFTRLLKNPLLFKSYTKSLVYQLNLHLPKNPKIIKDLCSLWCNELIKLNHINSNSKKIDYFLNTLQVLLLEKNHNPLLKKLIKDSINSIRRN